MCTLDDGLQDGIFEVFLPRSIVVSDEQEVLYNIDGNQTLSLVISMLLYLHSNNFNKAGQVSHVCQLVIVKLL